MNKRMFLTAAVLAIATLTALPAMAQGNTFKIGLILPMTGQQASTGRQIEAAARLYMAQNGDTVETLLKNADDAMWWSMTR